MVFVIFNINFIVKIISYFFEYLKKYVFYLYYVFEVKLILFLELIKYRCRKNFDY